MSSLARADVPITGAWPNSGRDPDVNRRLLDEMRWAHRGPRLRALGFDFAIRSSRAIVGRYIHGLLSSFEVPGIPRHMYSFLDGRHAHGERLEVYRDGEHVTTTEVASTALRHLLWDVNRKVIEESPNLYLLHASAVEHAGRAVLFPAPMESGKTTLVAGMVIRGLRYITDETVAIDPATLTVRPYPKPLAIDQGSWDALSELRPNVDPSLEPFVEAGWFVPPDAIRKDAVASPCLPGFVIAPRYERGARTELVEMRRPDALITLAENSFNIPAFGAQRSMDILAAVVRRSRCYRLTVGDLAEACAMVLELMDGVLENRSDT
jgi:hypothetical protein